MGIYSPLAAPPRHQARKRFGQHFLADDASVDAIVRAVRPMDTDVMVEIGPGMGALTLPLAAAYKGRLVLIEIDRDLARHWREQCAQFERLSLVEGDALRVRLDDLGAPALDTQKFRVVGNLPYNISTPILFHLLDQVDRVQDQHFMLQREVVERMVAAADTADFGRLSVMLQWRYAMESLFDIGPEAFDPPPRVMSSVVRMVPRAAPLALNRRTLESMLAAAFSQRRKLLRHSLGPWLRQHAPDELDTFDLQRRAQEVAVADYLALAQRIPASP